MEPGNWIFKGAFSNKIHDISESRIEELLELANEEDEWSQRVKDEVEYFDRHPGEGGPIFVNQHRIMNTAGAVVRFPYGDIITFRSKRHLFRGENQIFPESHPSMNRQIQKLSKTEQELYRAIANMRIWQFVKFIWKMNVVPFWEAKISDVNYKALAQHYGFETHLLDLTNDFRTALFFATCVYEKVTDSYRPLTKEEIEESDSKRYGMIFHSPDWVLDFMNGDSLIRWCAKHQKDCRKTPYLIDSGDLDGIAFQIGLQPFMRCHSQSGYVFPMRNEVPLQKNDRFEKIRFRQSEDLSRRIYELMDGGKKVFPHEGINDALPILRMMQESVTFSEDDMQKAYEEADHNIFGDIISFREALKMTEVAKKSIQFVSEEVEYPISQELISRMNKKYDDPNILLKPVDGKIYSTHECREYRRQRCLQIYGKDPFEM